MQKKRSLLKERIKREHGCNSSTCQECNRKFIIIDDMCAANIPVEYWFLFMKTFTGSPKLKEFIEKYITNLEDNYLKGKSICLSGSQGTGKTACAICILRSAIKSGYSVYYITAIDMLNEMMSKNLGEIKRKLQGVDFLVIDELDSRFFVSENVKEFFGGYYETIFRSRSHNMLPTIICTNETEDILNVFSGQCVNSIKSLNYKYLQTIPVIGSDIRKKNE